MPADTGVEAALTTVSADDSDIRELRDSLRRALGGASEGPPVIAADWRTEWSAIADLGAASFCVPEEHGGFGLRVDASVAAAIELGSALQGAPYPGITASAHALARAGDESWAAELLAGSLNGKVICAFGYLSANPGQARLIDGGLDADALALLDPDGSLVILTDPADWHAIPSSLTFDVSRHCADVTISPGAGRRLRDAGHADELYRLLLSADALGGVERMLELTVGYATQRQAFKRPIGGFQVVQHRLVDHKVRVRGMALLVAEAASHLSAESPDAGRFVSLAEVSVASGATHILHDLVQLTGAIGFTWEYGLHFYARRAHTTARLAANPRSAVRALAGIEGWTNAG